MVNLGKFCWSLRKSDDVFHIKWRTDDMVSSHQTELTQDSPDTFCDGEGNKTESSASNKTCFWYSNNGGELSSQIKIDKNIVIEYNWKVSSTVVMSIAVRIKAEKGWFPAPFLNFISQNTSCK